MADATPSSTLKGPGGQQTVKPVDSSIRVTSIGFYNSTAGQHLQYERKNVVNVMNLNDAHIATFDTLP